MLMLAYLSMCLETNELSISMLTQVGTKYLWLSREMEMRISLMCEYTEYYRNVEILFN